MPITGKIETSIIPKGNKTRSSVTSSAKDTYTFGEDMSLRGTT